MRLESAISTPIACEVAAARLIRTNSPDNDDDSIVEMWKTSLKRTRHKSSYLFSIWESKFCCCPHCDGRWPLLVEVSSSARLFGDRGHYDRFRLGNLVMLVGSRV